jgi:hypothetical protein
MVSEGMALDVRVSTQADAWYKQSDGYVAD